MVAAFITASDPTGNYGRDHRGVHHISPVAAVHCSVDEDAFGTLEVYPEKLKLHMAGKAPAGLTISGKCVPYWPEDLLLPHGGRLISPGDSPINDMLRWGIQFLHLWIYLVTTIVSPAAPIFKMLASSATQGQGDGSDPQGNVLASITAVAGSSAASGAACGSRDGAQDEEDPGNMV